MPLPLAPLVYGTGALLMRYGPQTLRGLQAWMRSPASKQAALSTVKMLPVTVAGDYAFDKLGRLAENQDIENFADAAGIAKAAFQANPYQAGVEFGLHKLGLDWEQFEKDLPSYTATTANAFGFNSNKPNLPVQQMSSPKRTDIRLNENFSVPQLLSRELNNDFTNLYNTPLTPTEQQGFNAWLKTLPENQRSMRDYDLQGYYKFARSGVDPKEFYLNHDNPDAHFNDYFKKPNHSTFSVYSKYNNQDGWKGSRWYPLSDDENRWILDVNSTNTRSPRGLARYMQEAESGNVFSDPRGQYSTVHYPLITPDSNVIF